MISISQTSMKRSIVRNNSTVGVSNQTRISLSFGLSRTLTHEVISKSMISKSMISKSMISAESWICGGQMSIGGGNVGWVIGNRGTVGVGNEASLAVYSSHQADQSQFKHDLCL